MLGAVPVATTVYTSCSELFSQTAHLFDGPVLDNDLVNGTKGLLERRYLYLNPPKIHWFFFYNFLGNARLSLSFQDAPHLMADCMIDCSRDDEYRLCLYALACKEDMSSKVL